MEEATLLDCSFQNWSPGIGDPTVRGWITVLIYTLSTLVAGRVAFIGPFPRRTRPRERFFWGCLTIGLGFLTINKQLDLQSFMTAIARCAALDGGWYEDRRTLQAVFLMWLAFVGIFLGLSFLWTLRGTMKRSALPLIGAVLVVTYVLIRAVSFHAVDKLIQITLPAGAGRVSVNFLLEVPGPLIILASGIWFLKQHRRRQTRLKADHVRQSGGPRE